MTTKKEFFYLYQKQKDKKITNNQGKIFKSENNIYVIICKYNYGLSHIQKLTVIKYWSRMNELTCFNWKYSKKLENFQKMLNLWQIKSKNVYFVTVLSFFYEITIEISVDN